MIHRAGVLGALSLFLGTSLLACSDDGPPPLSEITVTPGQVSLTFVGQTRSLTATVTDESGSTRTDVELTWSSNNAAAAIVSQEGVVSAAGNGSATIQASAGGVTSNPVSVTVDQAVTSIEIGGGDRSFSFLGETVQLSATARDQGGVEVESADLTWTSSNTSVASVSPEGRVEATGNGSTTIRARADQASSNGILVTVRQVASQVSIVGGGSLGLSSLGETAQLEIDARDSGGSPVQAPDASWASSNESVATVSQDGIVEAIGNGETQVTVTVDDVTSGALAVTVDQVAAEVRVEPELVTIAEVGGTAMVSATALDALGNPVADAEFVWESSDQGVVSVEADGAAATLTGVSEGIADVTAGSGDAVSDAVAVGVGVPPVPEIQSGERVSGLSGAAGDQLFYRIEVPAGTGELVVGIGGGTGDANLYLRRGELPTPEEFDCASGFGNNDDLCEVADPQEGVWIVLIDGAQSFSGLDLVGLTREGQPGFHIDLVFTESVDEAVRAAAESAAARWEAVLPKDLQGFWVRFFDACGLSDYDLSDPVDDMRVRVEVISLGDGEGGTLARAAWCLRRLVGNQDGPLPIAGAVQVDRDDLDSVTQEELEETLTHELGHALGFGGEIWEVVDPPLIEGAGGSDPIFTGPGAREAFDEVGGTEYQGAKVPLENQGGPGTADAHWRESVFGNELMSSFVGGEAERLSIVTIRAMADLGWTVDLSQADDYALPGASGSGVVGAEIRRIFLGNDLMDVPQYGIDEKGRIVKIRGPGKE